MKSKKNNHSKVNSSKPKEGKGNKKKLKTSTKKSDLLVLKVWPIFSNENY